MYDHRSHAGNQGDVVKHVALLAAARHAFENAPRVLRYVDAFSGPGGSLLLPRAEWTRGVGVLNRAANLRSPDVAAWVRWYLARPQLVGSRYPGSALIVADVGAYSGKEVAMTLWDVSAEAVADLHRIFPKQTIVHAPIDPEARAVRSADFLFIDPPGVASRARPNFPAWPLLLRLMSSGRHMLAWLPINVGVVEGVPGVSLRAKEQLDDVLNLRDTSATRVLWARGGRMIGCHLVHRCDAKTVASIRAAVREAVSLCSWPFKKVQPFNRPRVG